MKKVHVSILEKSPPNTYKFKVASTMKGSNFKEYIAREIVNLSDVDFYFIFTDKEQNPHFLDESMPFSQLTEQKKFKLRLVVRNQEIILKTGIGIIRKVTFDMKTTCFENIKSLMLDPNYQYALSFRPKGSSLPRIFSRKQPLVFQGWKGERLTLHRIASRAECLNRTPENLENLYKVCRLYLSDGVLYMKKEHWGEALGYLFLSLGKPAKDIKKPILQKLMPENIPLNDQMFQSAKKTADSNSHLTKEEASVRFVDHFFQYGILCAHVEEVKFLLKDKRWHMQTNRCIYISPHKLIITKNYNEDIVLAENISNVVSTNNDKENVIVTMTNGKQWNLKPDDPVLVRQLIDDAKEIGISLNQKQNKIAPQWDSTEITEASSSYFSSPSQYIQEQQTNQKENSSFLDPNPNNESNLEQNTIENQNIEQNTNENQNKERNILQNEKVTQVFFEKKPKQAKVIESEPIQENEDLNKKMDTKENNNNNQYNDNYKENAAFYSTSDKNKYQQYIYNQQSIPGISQIIIPKPDEEENAPYSISNEYFRDLKIVGNLEFPEDQQNELNLNDSCPDFSEMVKNNASMKWLHESNTKIFLFTVLLFLILFLFIKSW